MADGLKKIYFQLFGEVFPTFELPFMADDEIVKLLKNCIEQKRTIDNFISIQSNGKIM